MSIKPDLLKFGVTSQVEPSNRGLHASSCRHVKRWQLTTCSKLCCGEIGRVRHADEEAQKVVSDGRKINRLNVQLIDSLDELVWRGVSVDGCQASSVGAFDKSGNCCFWPDF